MFFAFYSPVFTRMEFISPTASTSALNQAPTGNGTPNLARPKRSRKNRPCDRCRKSKLGCRIDASGPPCAQCAESDRPCTFEAAPPPRPPPKRARSETETDGVEEYVPMPKASPIAPAQGLPVQHPTGVRTFDDLGSSFDPHGMSNRRSAELM